MKQSLKLWKRSSNEYDRDFGIPKLTEHFACLGYPRKAAFSGPHGTFQDDFGTKKTISNFSSGLSLSFYKTFYVPHLVPPSPLFWLLSVALLELRVVRRKLLDQ